MTEIRSTDRVYEVTYDHEARAQYQRFSNEPIARTEEWPDGTLVDLDADGNVVGVEKLW